jgi:hypothetical protein
MGFRDQLTAVPKDAWVGYATTSGFFLWFAVCVVEGPKLFILASWCLIYPTVAILGLVLAYKLAFRRVRKQRIVPLLLVSCCLATFPWASSIPTDLHLIYRIYRAGGPDNLNNWAQDLIRKRGSKTDGNTFVEFEQVPLGIRTHFPCCVSVDGTLWSDLVRVRIELGGGFYHYGVVVYPSESAPPPNWWHRALAWPAEVVIYHEE